MTLPATSHGYSRRVVRPRASSAGSGVFFAAARQGRRRVFYDLVFDGGALSSTRFDDFETELAGKRGESSLFSWTPPDTGVAVNVKIVRSESVSVRTPGIAHALSKITLEVFD